MDDIQICYGSSLFNFDYAEGAAWSRVVERHLSPELSEVLGGHICLTVYTPDDWISIQWTGEKWYGNTYTRLWWTRLKCTSRVRIIKNYYEVLKRVKDYCLSRRGWNSLMNQGIKPYAEFASYFEWTIARKA